MVSPLAHIVVGEAVIITALRMAWMALHPVGWIPAVSWGEPLVRMALPWMTPTVFIAWIWTGMVGSPRHRRVHR